MKNSWFPRYNKWNIYERLGCYQLFISTFITNRVCVSWASHDILLFYWRKSMSAYRRHWHWRDILEGPEALICTAGNASGCNPVDSLSLSLSLSAFRSRFFSCSILFRLFYFATCKEIKYSTWHEFLINKGSRNWSFF